MRNKKPVGEFEIVGGEIVISSVLPHVAIRLKHLFPQIPKTARPPLTMVMKPDVAEDFEWFLSRYKFNSKESDLRAVREVAEFSRNSYDAVESIFDKDYRPKPTALMNIVPRDYQLIARDVLLSKKRLLLGDDLGLGKTLSAILALIEEGVRPALVVVQGHLIKQWIDEILCRTGLTAREIKTTNPSKEQIKPADVYVTTYRRILGWMDVLCSGMVKTAVFDECQELRRPESKQYRAARNISSSVEYCLGMSATPVYNYGVEMFSVLDAIYPGCLGSREEFLREWCSDGDWHGRVKDPQALGSYLRERHLFLRRTRKEVGRELPPLNTIVHKVPHDEAEHEKVKITAESLANRVLSGSFVDSGLAAREFDLVLRMATGVSKASYVAEYVKILLENKEPVLLVGWHRAVYEKWSEDLKDFNPLFFTGSESASQKSATKERFLSGESDLIIMSLRSGIGLDGLQKRCKTVVIGELDWSPKVHEQIIGRLLRDGQVDQVTVIYLISDAGSDPVIVDLLGIKSEQSSGIIDPAAERVIEVSSDDSRIKEMARKYLKSIGK